MAVEQIRAGQSNASLLTTEQPEGQITMTCHGSQEGGGVQIEGANTQHETPFYGRSFWQGGLANQHERLVKNGNRPGRPHFQPNEAVWHPSHAGTDVANILSGLWPSWQIPPNRA